MANSKLFTVGLRAIDDIGPVTRYKVWGDSKEGIREFFVVTIEAAGMEGRMCIDSIEEEKLN